MCPFMLFPLVLLSVTVLLSPSLKGAILIKVFNVCGVHICGLIEGSSDGLLFGGKAYAVWLHVSVVNRGHNRLVS